MLILTKSQCSIKCWVEYIIGNLLNDNTRLIKSIVDTEIDEVEQKNELHKQIDTAIDFLTFGLRGVVHQLAHGIICGEHEDEGFDSVW